MRLVLLGDVVLGVLLEVAELARGLDARRHLASRVALQRRQLGLEGLEALGGDRFSVAHRGHCGGPAAAAACTSARRGRSPKPCSHHVAPASPSSASRAASGRSWLTRATSKGPASSGAVLRDDLEQRAHVVAPERRLMAHGEDAVVARRARQRPSVRPHAPEPHRRARLLQRRRAHHRAVKGEARRPRASPPSRPTARRPARAPRRAAPRGHAGRAPRRRRSARAGCRRPGRRRSTTRPPDRWSRTAAWRATSHGRRRARGVTIAPRRRRSVASATAVNAIHGSAHREPVERHHVVPDEEAVPAAALGARRHRGERANVGQLAEGRDVQAVAHGQAAAAATGHARRSS